MRYIFTILLLVVFMPITAKAQDTKEPSMPPTLKQFTEQGAQAYYLGNYGGMNGWVLIRQGKPEFFYENPERTALVMGLLFNDEGQMMTMTQLNELKRRVGDDMYATTGTGTNPSTQIPNSADAQTNENAETSETPSETENGQSDVAPQASNSESSSIATPLIPAAPTPAERMYFELIQANWFTINPEGTHDIFAFIDPDCIHCQQFIRNSTDFLEKGQLRLRVIPVGLNAESARRAAVLLASADPAERLIKYSDGDKEALPAPVSVNLDAIDKNTNLMVKNRFDVTPMIVYRTKQGETRIIRGIPSDYDNVIRDINEN